LHFRFQVVVDVLERRIVFVGVGFHGFVVRISDLEEDLFVVAGFVEPVLYSLQFNFFILTVFSSRKQPSLVFFLQNPL
jgi:hypothetical protein